MFGNAGREYMERYGISAETFARIGEKNHRHSANNPYAQFQEEYTLRDITGAAMTLVAAMELKRYGVRANCIAPVARTRLTLQTPGMSDVMARSVLDPENVSPLVACLATADCPFSGQVFSVYGRLLRRGRLNSPWAGFDGVQVGVREQPPGRVGSPQQAREQVACRPPARRPREPAGQALRSRGVDLAVPCSARPGILRRRRRAGRVPGRPGSVRQHRAHDRGDRAACRWESTGRGPPRRPGAGRAGRRAAAPGGAVPALAAVRPPAATGPGRREPARRPRRRRLPRPGAPRAPDRAARPRRRRPARSTARAVARA